MIDHEGFGGRRLQRAHGEPHREAVCGRASFSSRGHCGGALDLSAADARARGDATGCRRLQSGRGVRFVGLGATAESLGSGQRIRSASHKIAMVFEELPVVTVTETAIVKKAIVKSEARTQLTAAKKKKVP